MKLIIGLENHEDMVLNNPDKDFLNRLFDWYKATSELRTEEKNKCIYQAIQIGDDDIRMVIPFSKISFMYTTKRDKSHA